MQVKFVTILNLKILSNFQALDDPFSWRKCTFISYIFQNLKLYKACRHLITFLSGFIRVDWYQVASPYTIFLIPSTNFGSLKFGFCREMHIKTCTKMFWTKNVSSSSLLITSLCIALIIDDAASRCLDWDQCARCQYGMRWLHSVTPTCRPAPAPPSAPPTRDRSPGHRHTSWQLGNLEPDCIISWHWTEHLWRQFVHWQQPQIRWEANRYAFLSL